MMVALEICATVFGLSQGMLVLLNKKSNWIFYILQMICMIAFSLRSRLYGDFVNSCIYLILGVIGFILWNKGKVLLISQCNLKEKVSYILIISLSTLILSSILKNTSDPLPVIDAFTTTSSFVATYYMMTKKNRHMVYLDNQ